MGGVVTVEIAGATNSLALKVASCGIISSLAFEEPGAAFYRRAKTANLVITKRHQRGIVGVGSQYLGCAGQQPEVNIGHCCVPRGRALQAAQSESPPLGACDGRPSTRRRQAVLTKIPL